MWVVVMVWSFSGGYLLRGLLLVFSAWRLAMEALEQSSLPHVRRSHSGFVVVYSLRVSQTSQVNEWW